MLYDVSQLVLVLTAYMLLSCRQCMQLHPVLLPCHGCSTGTGNRNDSAQSSCVMQSTQHCFAFPVVYITCFRTL